MLYYSVKLISEWRELWTISALNTMIVFDLFIIIVKGVLRLTLSGLKLPLSCPSTTSRELLSQFSTRCGWRWLEGDEKWKKIYIHIIKQFHENFRSKTLRLHFKSFFTNAKWCLDASWGFKGLKRNVSQNSKICKYFVSYLTKLEYCRSGNIRGQDKFANWRISRKLLL